MVLSLLKITPGSDKLSRCGALESLVNDMADDSWDDKSRNRISAIHFLDEDDEEDDDKVRPLSSTLEYDTSLYICW